MAPRALIEQQIRDLLRHTWHPFFARFGRLRDVQRRAIKPILDGHNVLVSAPTASGKTEAVMGPLCERLLQNQKKARKGGIGTVGLALMIISPTRALCNDLARRLRRPVTSCGLTLGIKTGDSPGFDEKRPSNVLITTPESLDSLLCRRPKSLRQVRALMLDELHLIHNTPRGDQLAVLLARLSRVTEIAPQICAASATVPDVDEISARYLGADTVAVRSETRDGKTQQRRIEARMFEAFTLEDAAAVIADLWAEAPRNKLLVFANRRSEVESLAALLRGETRLTTPVMAHHGSLARAERLRTEKSFLEASSAICVATMTLEIGVDIGGVDQVVLLRPPPNVASLLQRVGRGNRQGNVTHVVCLYAGDLQIDRFEHLLDCAARGQLFADSVAFRPSILAQQALSLVYQNPKRWISAKALHGRLPLSVADRFRVEDCGAILDTMADQDLIRPFEGSRFTSDVGAERAFELGTFHSNIADSPEIEVIDETTGRSVGRVRFSKKERQAAASGAQVTLSLGGRARQVSRVHQNQIVVRSHDANASAQFIAQQAPRYSFALARDFARHLGLRSDEMWQERIGDSVEVRLWHCLGTLYGRIFDLWLSERGLRKGNKRSPFFTALKRSLPADRLTDGDGLRQELESLVRARAGNLAKVLQPGPFWRSVPSRLQQSWLLESLNLSVLAGALRTMRVVDTETLATEGRRD